MSIQRTGNPYLSSEFGVKPRSARGLRAYAESRDIDPAQDPPAFFAGRPLPRGGPSQPPVLHSLGAFSCPDFLGSGRYGDHQMLPLDAPHTVQLLVALDLITIAVHVVSIVLAICVLRR